MTSFFHMGGYGFYVWGSYGLLALAILIELASLRAGARVPGGRLAVTPTPVRWLIKTPIS